MRETKIYVSKEAFSAFITISSFVIHGRNMSAVSSIWADESA